MTAQIIKGVEPAARKQVSVPASIEFDGLVKHLAFVVAAAQELPAADQKRFTDFVLAAGSLMLARTRLNPTDQKVFEAALHEAAARKNR